MEHEKGDEGSGAGNEVKRDETLAFGVRLREARKAAGMTQGDVARAIWAKNRQGSVSRWECGAYVPVQHLSRLAAVLHTTPAYLLGYDDAPQEEKGCKRCGMARDLLTAALGAAARTNDADLRSVLIAPLQRLLATMRHGASGEVNDNE